MCLKVVAKPIRNGRIMNGIITKAVLGSRFEVPGAWVLGSVVLENQATVNTRTRHIEPRTQNGVKSLSVLSLWCFNAARGSRAESAGHLDGQRRVVGHSGDDARAVSLVPADPPHRKARLARASRL